MTVRVITGDCLEMLPTLPAGSVDSICTDPPYGIGFMGKAWDHGVPSVAIWRECLRVLKPGGHLLAFAGTRTQHRMATAIEDAGFEIRDMIAWVYAQGWPKNLDVSKAIDKAAGAVREVVGSTTVGVSSMHRVSRVKQGYRPNLTACDGSDIPVTAPATDAARQWQGWGTALKPALEPITVARKPLVGTVVANVLQHGAGALNLDGCRVDGGARPLVERDHQYRPENFNLPSGSRSVGDTTLGRWPANLIHDGSDEVVAAFPETKSGDLSPYLQQARQANAYGLMPAVRNVSREGDSGSAARFFYTAKASTSDRGHGNNHATVKPTALMQYLVRLVTPPGGTVLDPFCGSGTTLLAADREQFDAIGIELDAGYAELTRERFKADAGLFADLA